MIGRHLWVYKILPLHNINNIIKMKKRLERVPVIFILVQEQLFNIITYQGNVNYMSNKAYTCQNNKSKN